ncbi:MAG TPA: winged helix DNA-binding domain-containing protein [Solirubrobacteraceae bacterium]|nr:winged helix DNA-binding domain-containing protein [Solirubrobacteraceae bacterium]
MRTATDPRSAAPLLTRRALGRATLARQLLLERAPISAVDAVAALAGMQAQEPRPPFVGLWSRLADFRAEELLEALRAGAVFRGPLFRATLHLVTEADWSVFRAPCQPALSRALRVLGTRAQTLDLERLVEVARGLLQERPRTAGELRALLHAAFPDEDPRALGYAVRTNLSLAMVATEDPWGFPRDPRLRLAKVTNTNEDASELVRRYLAAYGPASVADAQEWSGVGGLAPTFDALGPALARFTDERGRELFDLPGAPRPGGEVPAPARYLPEFDSLVLAHADRSRLIADEHRRYLTTKNLRVNATALYDGEVCATWTVRRTARTATLEITPFAVLSSTARRALESEGLALLAANEATAATRTVAVLAPPRG